MMLPEAEQFSSLIYAAKLKQGWFAHSYEMNQYHGRK